MWFIIFTVIVLIIFLLGYVVSIYNHLVLLKNNVTKSWANIDVLLKQRHDELVKLIDVCKKYMLHETTLLTSIVELRTKAETIREVGDVDTIGKIEGNLQKSLGSMFAVAENYPELKSNNNFIELQTRVSALENSIADRRELYNENVTINNTRLQQFPDILVARLFNFKSATLLEFSEEELADLNLNSLFIK